MGRYRPPGAETAVITASGFARLQELNFRGRKTPGSHRSSTLPLLWEIDPKMLTAFMASDS